MSKLPSGVGTVGLVTALAIASGIALNAWIGNIEHTQIWFVATVAIAVLTICIAAFGFYCDWRRGN